MIDKDLIYRKLSRLKMYLDELKPISEKPFKEYLANPLLKASAERFIQLIVECASDVNNHTVVESGKRPPEDYTSSFIKAAECGLIDRELAERIKGSAGMRNVLVHEYMDIDDEKVYKTIPVALKDYKEYIKQVNAFLEKQGK
jgi:uncharacterized protein YutE (UPF0331/DUF86 family)